MESPASGSSPAFPPIPDHNELRLEIARRCVERKRRELGDAMLAGAVYGSVAYGAAAEHSDVEVIVVTDESVEERDENFFDEGIQVECAIVRAERVLESAGKVGWDWGITADAYRHQVPIWDPGAFFERLRAAAASIPDEDFTRTLEGTWWWCFETRGKFLNALAADDVLRALNLGWQFAYAGAMRLALRDRKPYESMRTLWTDAASRTTALKPLLEGLSGGGAALPEITRCIDNLWDETRALGVPAEAASLTSTAG
jgi:hypothetical protein